MSSGKFWSPKKRAVAVTLRKEGYSYRDIANKLGSGATASGVLKVWQKFEETGKVVDKERAGRPRISTSREDRSLVRMSLVNPQQPSTSLMQCWDVNASKSTVKRRLKEAGLNARIPRKKPFLNMRQRKQRVHWAKQHVNWTSDHWNKVIWSDETRISLFASDGVRYVWRRSGEDLRPECMRPSVKYPESVMVWGCMAAGGVGRLHVVDGTLTARKYIDDVLEKKLLPSIMDIAGDQGDPIELIFQQDNAPSHTAKICKSWFTRNNIQVMDWPGNSPDLNPIENLWSQLKRKVAKYHPTNRRQLIEAIINCWHHVIDKEDLKGLVDSMPRRCMAVIKAKGYPTRY
jgi:transposase